MKTIEVYDPAMCCPSGVCGPSVDPKLVQFAADLEWLKGKGLDVKRYNLSQQPDQFVNCKAVQDAMVLAGELCLPLILVDGKIAFRAAYPPRRDLARLAGLSETEDVE